MDVFYTFYYPVPALEEQPPLEWGEEAVFRRRVLESLLMSPNLWRAKPYTTADSLTSVVAAASFVERLARLLSRLQRPQRGRSRDREEKEGRTRVARARGSLGVSLRRRS